MHAMSISITARNARGRRVGRPAGDDPKLRDALLDTAVLRFAQEGVAAASLRSIAKAAAVTPAMLHYYFGDKRRLTEAVIEERLLPAVAPLRHRVGAAAEGPTDALIEAFVRGTGEMVTAHPWLPSLWVREVLCEGGVLREAVFSRGLSGLPQIMARHFERAQAEGHVAKGIDPRLLVVSLVGLTLFPAAGEPIWRRLFATDGVTPQVRIEHTLALLGHGVRGASS